MVKLPAANSVAGKARARNLAIAEAGKAAGLSSSQIAQQQQRTASTTPTTPTNPVLPTQTVTPPVEPTPTAPVAPTTTVLPISKESAVYKQLAAKGYDDAKILDLYNKAKASKTPEEQARITKNEPKVKSTAVDPIAEPTTPQVQPQAKVEPTTQTQPADPTTTPVEKPVEIKPQKEMNKTGTMELLPVSEYQDNSSERMNNIVANLNSYRQSTPQFMSNIDVFRDNFAYEKRSDQQKKLLDNWYLGYQKGVELLNMGTTSIVDQYTSGNITSSDLEQLRLNNPAKYQEAMDAINKKDLVRTYQNELYETDEQKTIMAQLDEVSGQGDIFEEYKKTINSDEVKALQSEIQDMETQREQLSLELNDIKDQVEKRYEGTGATKGKIAYIVAKESAALQKQITSLGIDSANRVDKYNSIVNTAKETMQLQLQEQEAERAARNQKMSELGFYYQYDPVGMAERAENIFNIENPDINSPDANTARRALNNELTKYYEKYGDIIIRPQSQALNDILAQAKADGTSLSAALKKNFTDQLQSKSLYGQMLGKNIGIDMGTYNMVQGKDGNWNISEKPSVSYGAGSIAGNVSGGYNSNASRTGNTITNMGSATDTGVDYDVNVGDEIQAPVGGTLSLQQDSKTGNVYAKITQANGDTVQINHLDQSTLTKLSSLNGKQISAGTVIGYGGNSGNVKDINGNWLRKDGKVFNQQALNSGTGSHLDVRVNTGGKQLYGQDLVNYLNGKSNTNDANFEAYLKSASDNKDGTKAFGGTEAERMSALKEMGYSSWAAFNKDYNNWLQSKAQDKPDEGFMTALKYVTENPLFDYVDANGVKQKGLLGKQGFIDSKTISQIEDNLMKGNKWDMGLGVKQLFNLKKFPQIGNFVESLKTIRNSKVIDIVKTGKVKLYPMSDADIGLLAGSVGLQVNSFAEPNKAKATMKALNNMIKAYEGSSVPTQTTQNQPVNYNFGGASSIGNTSRMSNLSSLVD